MKKDIKQMNLMCQSHSGLPSARRKLRHTAITPKPQGKGISAHSLVATTQSRCHLASIDRNAAPRRTLLPRGRSPLPLSPTAALWAKRLRTGRFLLDSTSTWLVLPLAGHTRAHRHPRIEESHCPPPKSSTPGRLATAPLQFLSGAINTSRSAAPGGASSAVLQLQNPNFTHQTSLRSLQRAPAWHRMLQIARLLPTIILRRRLI